MKKPAALSLTTVSLLILAGLPLASALSAQDVCSDAQHSITRLGATPFTDSVKSPAQLQEQMEEHRDEVLQILEQRGLTRLAGPLYAAFESGEGLSDRTLASGETFAWMASRKKGVAQSQGPVCLATKKTYQAYEVVVTEEESTTVDAKCMVKTAGMCAHEKISADTAGSSDGATLVMTSPDGKSAKVGSSWEGMPSGPGDYVFTVKASATGTKTLTPHTFVVPHVCGNLAYAGAGDPKTVDGEVSTCSESTTLTVKTCMPDCTLTAPATAVSRAGFTLDASGNYDDLNVVAVNEKGRPAKLVDGEGNALASIGDLPATIAIKKKGIYTFRGEATNAAGSATCEAQVEILPPDRGRWTLRFFPLKADVDDEIFTSSFRPDGVNERSDLHLSGGEGLGAGLEYHFNDRIGLEGQLLLANLDATLFYDLDDAWAHDDDEARMTVLALGPNFHLSPNSAVDFYVGPFLAFVDVGSTSFSVLGDTRGLGSDSDFSFGAQLGLDIPFGSSSWALHLGAKYIDASISADEFEGQEVALDPLIAVIGLAYSF